MLNLGLGLNRYNKVGGLLPQTKAHLLRVTSNGGIVEDPKLLNTYIN